MHSFDSWLEKCTRVEKICTIKAPNESLAPKSWYERGQTTDILALLHMQCWTGL